MRTVVIWLSLTALVCAGIAPTFAADSVGRDDNTVNLRIQEAPVYDVLKMVFEKRGLNYVVDDGVKRSKVVLHMELKDVPFETAIEEICRAANITFRRSNNVYHFRLRTAMEDDLAKLVTCSFQQGEPLEPALHKMWTSRSWESPYAKAIESGKYDKSPVPTARFSLFCAADVDKWMTYEAHRSKTAKPGPVTERESLCNQLGLRVLTPANLSIGAVNRNGTWIVILMVNDHPADEVLSTVLNIVGADYGRQSLKSPCITLRLCGVPLEEALKSIADAGDLSCTRSGSAYIIKSLHPAPQK